MTDQARRHLAQADRHIAECKTLIARQEDLVRRVAQRGQPTDWAEDTLHALQSSLHAFEVARYGISGPRGSDKRPASFPKSSPQSPHGREAERCLGISGLGATRRAPLQPSPPQSHERGTAPTIGGCGRPPMCLERAARAIGHLAHALEAVIGARWPARNSLTI